MIGDDMLGQPWPRPRSFSRERVPFTIVNSDHATESGLGEASTTARTSSRNLQKCDMMWSWSDGHRLHHCHRTVDGLRARQFSITVADRFPARCARSSPAQFTEGTRCSQCCRAVGQTSPQLCIHVLLRFGRSIRATSVHLRRRSGSGSSRTVSSSEAQARDFASMPAQPDGQEGRRGVLLARAGRSRQLAYSRKPGVCRLSTAFT